MRLLRNIGEIIVAGLSLLPIACSEDQSVVLPVPEQPNLEQRLILNEGEDVNLGDTFFINSMFWPQEVLKFVENDTANKTLKFIKPGTVPEFTREITYDSTGFGTLIINGKSHGVHVNPNGSLRVDLDANAYFSNNSTTYPQSTIVDKHAKIVGGNYFFIKNKDGNFMPYMYSGASWGAGAPREVIFADVHNWLDRHYYLEDDGNGNLTKEIDFNGTKILVSGTETSDEITLSGFDDKGLDCLIRGTIVANEGRSIKPGEHFLIDTMDSPSSKGEVWKYLGKDPVAESSLKFRKYGSLGFENQDITISNEEGMLMASGFAYRVRHNADDSINVDLDKSGSIGKNEVPLLNMLVFNETRDVLGGDVFVLQNHGETEDFHSAYRLQLIDKINKRIYVTNLNTGVEAECSFSDEGDGTIVSAGIAHPFKISPDDYLMQIDLNGDGKIE